MAVKMVGKKIEYTLGSSLYKYAGRYYRPVVGVENAYSEVGRIPDGGLFFRANCYTSLKLIDDTQPSTFEPSLTLVSRRCALLQRLDDIATVLINKGQRDLSNWFSRFRNIVTDVSLFQLQGLSLGLKDNSKLSYPKQEKHYDDDKRRIESKLKPFLNYLAKLNVVYGRDAVKDWPAEIIEAMATAWGEFKDVEDCYRFVPCRGDDLLKAYEKENIGSCFSGSARVRMLTENPDVASTIRIDDMEGNQVGRANVYTLKNGARVADYVYPRSGLHIRAFESWAAKQGIYILNPSYRYDQMDDPGTRDSYIEFIVPVEPITKNTPARMYVDSFLVVGGDQRLAPGTVMRCYRDVNGAKKHKEPVLFNYNSTGHFGVVEQVFNPINGNYRYTYDSVELVEVSGRFVPSQYAEEWKKHFATQDQSN